VSHLYDLFKPEDLLDNLNGGFVRSKISPEGTRVIFNYTNATQYAGEWNDVTKQTRGLIIDRTTNEIVARPFPKFFNWSQLDTREQTALMKRPVEAYVKWDGSLGVGYTLNTGEFCIATRGSFTSQQAQHATEYVQQNYPYFEPIQGLTYLFEIIYPENRIVVDYRSMDAVILLAVIDNESGKTLPHGAYDWPGLINYPLDYRSLAEVLAAPQKPNNEGFVVRFPHNDMRVKIKFDEYVILHSMLTETSTLTIWKALATGAGVDHLLDRVPDEFYDWVRKQVQRLTGDFGYVKTSAQEEFDWIMRRVKRPEWDKAARKEFALLAMKSEYKDVLFGLYDGKDISARLWQRIKPAYSKPFWTEEA
jgi:RNA ligase